MILKDSEYKGSVTYKWVYATAKSAEGDDPYDYRSEFLKLVQTEKALDSKQK
jgi:hypothetical protein